MFCSVYTTDITNSALYSNMVKYQSQPRIHHNTDHTHVRTGANVQFPKIYDDLSVFGHNKFFGNLKYFLLCFRTHFMWPIISSIHICCNLNIFGCKLITCYRSMLWNFCIFEWVRQHCEPIVAYAAIITNHRLKISGCNHPRAVKWANIIMLYLSNFIVCFTYIFNLFT